MSADSLKFLRALKITPNSGTLSNVMQYHFKLLYEFWGFCVNGTNDLRFPGGMPISSSNFISMSAGFGSGSATLLASGSDGSTDLGGFIFTAPSINWTSGTMVGRHLVTWQSGSNNTDDSIYEIVKVIGSSSIRVDTNSGGTPHVPSGLRPAFTARTNINFRVVDLLAASTLPGFVSGSHMILQLNGGSFNVGQRSPQVRLAVSSSASTLSSCAISMSPSGSWTGTAFTDGTPELTPDTTTPGTTTGGTNRYWFDGTTGEGRISMWADQGSLIMHTRGDWNSAASYFHIEVPKRLYPADKDPNPICCMNSGIRGISIANSGISSSQHHYAAGWHLSNPFDNLALRRWNLMTRCPIGYSFFEHEDYIASRPGYGNTGVSSRVFVDRYASVRTGKVLVFDLILAHRHTVTSYSIGRVQLRRAALLTELWGLGVKIGADGEWIGVGDGVLWPWDNANLPYNILAAGS